jgi:hypothetical protein
MQLVARRCRTLIWSPDAGRRPRRRHRRRAAGNEPKTSCSCSADRDTRVRSSLATAEAAPAPQADLRSWPRRRLPRALLAAPRLPAARPPRGVPTARSTARQAGALATGGPAGCEPLPDDGADAHQRLRRAIHHCRAGREMCDETNRLLRIASGRSRASRGWNDRPQCSTSARRSPRLEQCSTPCQNVRGGVPTAPTDVAVRLCAP